MKLPAINKQLLKRKAVELGITSAITTAFIVGSSIYFEVYQWNYQSPLLITIQSPLVVTKRTHELVSPQPVQAATQSAVIEVQEVESMTTSKTVAGLVKAIHKLESSQGRNKAGLAGYCESLGKTNEYGYNASNNYCFDTPEEAEARVTRWVDEHLKQFNGDVARTLCFYNLGESQVNCKYYQLFLGL